MSSVSSPFPETGRCAAGVFRGVKAENGRAVYFITFVPGREGKTREKSRAVPHELFRIFSDKGLTKMRKTDIIDERFGEAALNRITRRDGRVVDGAGLENQ